MTLWTIPARLTTATNHSRELRLEIECAKEINQSNPSDPFEHHANRSGRVHRCQPTGWGWVVTRHLERGWDKAQKEPDFGFCFASYRWANGHSLGSILKGTDMTVGDFVRSIRQLIDLLTQIGGAAESLRPVCKDAIQRLDRGGVSDMLADV